MTAGVSLVHGAFFSTWFNAGSYHFGNILERKTVLPRFRRLRQTEEKKLVNQPRREHDSAGKHSTSSSIETAARLSRSRAGFIRCGDSEPRRRVTNPR